MALDTIIDRVCFYSQRPEADFVRGGTDILMTELNEARKDLERLYHFKSLHDTGTMTVSGSVGDLGALVTTSGRTYKSIRALWLVSSEGDVPVTYLTKEMLHRRKLANLRRQGVTDIFRYPGDVGALDYINNVNIGRVFIDDQKIRIDNSTESVTLRVDCHTWNDAWTADTDEDWFTEECSDYLMWATLKRINFFTQTYPDYRQEGTVSSGSLDKMIENAKMMIMSNENFDNVTGLILP